MSRVPLLKQQPKPELQLESLLKRRKTTLASFVKTDNITTYNELVTRCDRLGVSPPTLEKCRNLFPVLPEKSAPNEGIVIVELEPLTEISEKTGKRKCH